jgi:hypothetical protein
MKKQEIKDKEKKKGIFARMMEKLDKKLEEKSKKSTCCGSNKDKGSSCC